jgi:hypothetical protein
LSASCRLARWSGEIAKTRHRDPIAAIKSAKLTIAAHLARKIGQIAPLSNVGDLRIGLSKALCSSIGRRSMKGCAALVS